MSLHSSNEHSQPDTPRKEALKRRNADLVEENKHMKFSAKRTAQNLQDIRDRGCQEKDGLMCEMNSSKNLFAEALLEKEREIQSVKKELKEAANVLEMENSVLEEKCLNLNSSKTNMTKKFAATRRHLLDAKKTSISFLR